jgi:hypothetical protein
MERALDVALSPRGLAFDQAAWRESALASLDTDHGHAAALGYVGVALGLHRELFGASRYSDLHDGLTDALTRRIEASPIGLIETDPHEIYPMDNAAVLATIALRARARGEPEPDVVRKWVARFRARYVDGATGLAYQSVQSDGSPLDGPRGSGTALAVYFLSFVDRALSYELHQAVQDRLHTSALGFGLVREYPRGVDGRGDIDSGPIVLGISLSATGFALAGCRIHRDARCYEDLFSSMALAGAPLERDGERTNVSGGPLSDAILLAMQTARPRVP